MKRRIIFKTVLAGMLALAAFSLFAACSSGPKVYSIGNSGSRVTIQQAD